MGRNYNNTNPFFALSLYLCPACRRCWLVLCSRIWRRSCRCSQGFPTWLSAPARITVRPPPRFPRKSRKGWKEGISCRRNRIRRVDGSSIIPPSGGINGRPTGTLLGRNIFFHWMESGTLFSCTSAVTLGDAMIPCRRRAACNYLLGRSTRDDAGSPD